MPLLWPRDDDVADWSVATISDWFDNLHVFIVCSLAGNKEVVLFCDVDVVDLHWVEDDLDVVRLVQTPVLRYVELADDYLYL